jgi:hypothetical protein
VRRQVRRPVDVVSDAAGAQDFVYKHDHAEDRAEDQAAGTTSNVPGPTAPDATGETDARVGGAPHIVIHTHKRAPARLLIACGGRPWKKFQVIPVRPSREYVRAVSTRHGSHSRTEVVGGPLGGPLDGA